MFVEWRTGQPMGFESDFFPWGLIGAFQGKKTQRTIQNGGGFDRRGCGGCIACRGSKVQSLVSPSLAETVDSREACTSIAGPVI